MSFPLWPLRQNLLTGVRLVALLLLALPAAAQVEQHTMTNANWAVSVSAASGAITAIRQPQDTTHMNWVHPTYEWGTLCLTTARDTLVFNHPDHVAKTAAATIESVYQLRGIRVQVARHLGPGNAFQEAYTITNTSKEPLHFPAGALDVTVPFPDSYEGGAAVALTQRCNAHLWATGASAYVNGLRMSGQGPHLGLTLTQGALAGYSLAGATFSNDRGRISLNPEEITLQPGQHYTLAWQLFWHTGWADFWQQALRQPHFVRLQAAAYTVVAGQRLTLTGQAGSALQFATLRQNGQLIPLKIKGNTFTATVVTTTPGEQIFELAHAGRKDRVVANVIAPPLDLLKARVAFIIAKQQRQEPGSPLDGAYLIYDNETEKQFWATKNDWNEARERVGMGVLLALYLPHCQDPMLKRNLVASLQRFEAFIAREIQDTAGVVYNAAHYKDSHRIYNSPWVGHFHLAMYHATHDRRYLHLFAKTVTAYYSLDNGRNFRAYPIGLQLRDGLAALKEAGLTAEYDRVYACFHKHAATVAAIGNNYPTSEVAYEQSIVAPGVQIELEAYLATKDPTFLASARAQLPLLEAFNGQQPDYRLHELAIRHWDGYWFGKYRLYGDTFPHYWQTLTAVAFDEYAEATGAKGYRERAQSILLSNLCQFTPEGRAYCAYLYPLKTMGAPGQRFDPWANDQDWALVNLLTLYNRGHLKW